MLRLPGFLSKRERLETNMSHPLAPDEAQVTCGICMEDFHPINGDGDSLNVCLCGEKSIGTACPACMKTHFEMIVNNGFDGACAPMTCPFHPKRIVHVREWKKAVSSSIFSKVMTRARATLSIQCGGCHARKDMWISNSSRPSLHVATLNDMDMCDKALIEDMLKTDSKASEHMAMFKEMRNKFLCGLASPLEFVVFLKDTFMQSNDYALGPGDSHGNPCSTILNVIHSLGGDPEREAALHNAYLRKFPACYTTCCKRLHCYRCHIRDFHHNMTCEEYQASQTTVEDVVPCPQCGLQLTKGDGCSGVNCVCGKSFDWNVELKKVHVELAKSFARDFEGHDSSGIADMAVLIKYHGGVPPALNMKEENLAAAEEVVEVIEKKHTISSVISSLSKKVSSRSALTSEPVLKKVDAGGMVVRAAAWSRINDNMIRPAQSRLFVQLTTRQYTKQVLPYAAHHYLNSQVNKRDRVLAEAWQVHNVDSVVEAKRMCCVSRANYWAAMHYCDSKNYLLQTTLREQTKLSLSKSNLSKNQVTALREWLLVETNREAIMVKEREISQRSSVNRLVGWDAIHGSRATSIAVDMLDRQALSTTPIAGDAYEACLKEWLHIHRSDVLQERSRRFENFRTSLCAGDTISLVSLAVDFSVGYCQHVLPEVRCSEACAHKTNASAWVESHREETIKEKCDRWAKAVCAAIEVKHTSLSEKNSGMSAPPRFLASSEGATPMSSVLHELAVKGSSVLSSGKKQAPRMSNCPAVDDPIQATTDVMLQLRPDPQPEAEDSRFSVQALKAYFKTFKDCFQTEINQVMINRWAQLSKDHYQRKLQHKVDLLKTAEESVSTMVPSFTYATSYTNGISPLTNRSCIANEEDRRALEYSVDVLVKEVPKLSSAEEKYRQKWLQFAGTLKSDAMEREKVRRWIQYSLDQSSQSTMSVGAGGGGMKVVDEEERMIAAAVELATDVQINAELRAQLPSTILTYLNTFLQVPRVSEMINHCQIKRFEHYAISEVNAYDPAASLALDCELQSCSGDNDVRTTNKQRVLPFPIKEYLVAWLNSETSKERLEKVKVRRLLGYANLLSTAEGTREVCQDVVACSFTSPAKDLSASVNSFFDSLAVKDNAKFRNVPYKHFITLSSLSVLAVEKKVSFACDAEEEDENTSAMESGSKRKSRKSRRVGTGVRPPPRYTPYAPREEWQCTRCTFVNPSGRGSCEMCGKIVEMPTEVDRLAWCCHTCTYSNIGFRTTCEVCGTLKTISATNKSAQPLSKMAASDHSSDQEIDIEALPPRYSKMLHVGVSLNAVISQLHMDNVMIPYKSKPMIIGNHVEAEYDDDVFRFLYPLWHLVLDAEEDILSPHTSPSKKEVEICYAAFVALFPFPESFFYKALKQVRVERLELRANELMEEIRSGNLKQDDKCIHITELLKSNIINEYEACALVAKSRLKHFVPHAEVLKYLQASAWSKNNSDWMDRASKIETWLHASSKLASLPALPKDLNAWYDQYQKQALYACGCGAAFESASKYYSHRGRCGELGGK